MIRYKSQKQLMLAGFDTPPDMILDPENRWVKLLSMTNATNATDNTIHNISKN